MCVAANTDYCQHAYADQQDISLLFGNDGIASRNFTTRRTQTCRKLYQGVAELGYLLIKAPPQGSKTSMLRLLSEWVAKEHPSVNVLYINLSLEDTSLELDDMFRKRLGGTLRDFIYKGTAPLQMHTGTC